MLIYPKFLLKFDQGDEWEGEMSVFAGGGVLQIQELNPYFSQEDVC